MIFGYVKYRPRNFALQILSSLKFFTVKRQESKTTSEQMGFRPVPQVNRDRTCIKCDICITQCPTDAISYTHNESILIQIDTNLCRPCRLCVEMCPTEYFSYKNSSHSQVRFGKRMEKFLEN